MIDSLVLPREHRLSPVLARFRQVRQTTTRICQPLAAEDYVPQPMTDVSPPKWHLAHTTWFFETFVLGRFIPGYQPFHPVYNLLFNSYYNTIGTRVARNERGFLSRPTVAEMYAYRQHVDEQLSEIEPYLTEADETEFRQLMEIGCQHEQQHQELLITDLKYILSRNLIKPVYHQPVLINESESKSVPPVFLPVEAGLYTIGCQGNDFCFDNELQPHQVFLQDFKVQNRLVTNAEYLEFMQDGGYSDFRHWLAEGWDTVNREGWQHPLYWEDHDGEWYEFSLRGLIQVDPNAPACHLSFFEASAYAAWAGKRLLTEFEWEVAARKFNSLLQTDNGQDNWAFHPLPAHSDNPAGGQWFGELWQWTNSAYLPYPGFRIAEGALGEYNGKFMMNQMVLRGSSCATPVDHMRHSYRNFFPAYSRWQFAGIRLAE